MKLLAEVTSQPDFDAAQTELRAVVTTAVSELQAQLRAQLAQPKSGRVYARRGGKHTASAPGEAPASDTGTLGASIQTQLGPSLLGRVEAGVSYAELLERGTARLQPRPLWEKTATVYVAQLEAAVGAALEKL